MYRRLNACYRVYIGYITRSERVEVIWWSLGFSRVECVGETKKFMKKVKKNCFDQKKWFLLKNDKIFIERGNKPHK